MTRTRPWRSCWGRDSWRHHHASCCTERSAVPARWPCSLLRWSAQLGSFRKYFPCCMPRLRRQTLPAPLAAPPLPHCPLPHPIPHPPCTPSSSTLQLPASALLFFVRSPSPATLLQPFLSLSIPRAAQRTRRGAAHRVRLHPGARVPPWDSTQNPDPSPFIPLTRIEPLIRWPVLAGPWLADRKPCTQCCRTSDRRAGANALPGAQQRKNQNGQC